MKGFRLASTLQPRLVINLAFIGFIAMLMALLAHAAWHIRNSEASLEEIERSTRVSSAYHSALNSATLAELHITRFYAEHHPADRQAYQSALGETFRAAGVIKSLGDDEARRDIDEMLDYYTPLIIAARSALLAIEAGRPAPAVIPETSLVQDIQGHLRERAAESQAKADRALEGYQDVQRRQLLISLAAFALSLPLVGGLLLIIRRYERRAVYSAVELHRMEQASLTDSLTGLGNHRAFQEALGREVAQARQESYMLCLVMADVDRFKDVNDSEGHAKGDQILLQLARLLQKAVGEHLYRIGGDEFAIVLPGWPLDRAQAYMESLRILASESLSGSTLSLGLAAFDEQDDGEILREKADIALYMAKRRGRNALCVYAGETGVSSPVTQTKINALRYLLQYASLDVAFQPLLVAKDSTVLGYEALARIPARFGLSGPQEAFDIAERLGRSYDLDMICLREILAAAAHLPKDGKLFINLSPRSLEHADFHVSGIVRMVEDAGIDLSRVVLELTERSNASIELVQTVTGRLRAAGFGIALDDVGSGNSGLEMLRRVPVEFVKIDRSVVYSALEPGIGRGVLKAIVAFASEAGAFVIAEGIEDEAMLGVVQGINAAGEGVRIQGVQGYLLGRPAALSPEPALPAVA